MARLTWNLEREGKRKRAFLNVIPLLPRHGADPAALKLDIGFLCVMELVALLVTHLLKCFFLDHSPDKLRIPYPLVSTLLRASEPQQGFSASRITPCTWQPSCSRRVVSRVSAPGQGGWGSGYQPPPSSCPLCPQLKVNANGQGGHGFCCLEGNTPAAYVRRFG